MIQSFEGSAPGRLDVMGGIADYSGSLVLQMPIANKTQVLLTLRTDYVCTLTSRLSTGETFRASFDFRLFLNKDRIDYSYAKEKFKEQPSNAWSAYVIGCVLVLMKEKGISFTGGDFTITSDVPLGKGVSSSASIEVATMKALQQAFHLDFSKTELPRLAQQVENAIVGAPCGLMDQLACYLGEPNKLLPILCQPDLVQDPISIPAGISFIGIDSGIRHSVAGASYSDVRCAAFMGYTMIAIKKGATFLELESFSQSGNWELLPYEGYLCNIPVGTFHTSILASLPESISGEEFLEHYLLSIDPYTHIEPAKKYSIKACTSHPVYENERVHHFQQLLMRLQHESNEQQKIATLVKMGSLMYESHESYSACGLGSDRTDEIVALAKKSPGIYGAKITGGGNGGTVCLLVDKQGKDSVFALHQFLCNKYQQSFVLFNQ